jgi:DNA-binding response OmpR family regulator
MLKKKLLLVGDPETAGILDAAGYEVTRVESAIEAAGRINGYVPDLILVDDPVVPDALSAQGIPIVLLAEVDGPDPGGSRNVIYRPCRPRTLIERVEHVLRSMHHA